MSIPDSGKITEIEVLFDISFRDFAFAEALDRAVEEDQRRDQIPDDDFVFDFVPRALFRHLREKPIENEDLKRNSSPESSNSGDLNGIPAESYCAWDPRTIPQSLRKKSSKRWRLFESPKTCNTKKSEILVRAKKGPNYASRDKDHRRTEADAHRIFHGDRVGITRDKRRTFLPYRQDLLGIFAV